MNYFSQEWFWSVNGGKVVIALLALIAIMTTSRLLKSSITRHVQGKDVRYRLRKFVNLVSYLVIVIFLTIIFGEYFSNLTVAIGVAGAGIAFALQEVIASFAGWFAINFAGFYKSGDRVQLGGIKGDVIDISFLRTTLMEVGEWVNADLYSGRTVRVANSFVFKEPVFNYSGEFPFLWDEITIPVMYGSDYHLAREILERLSNDEIGEYAKQANISWEDFSKHFLLEDAVIEPLVTLIANDNWMEFTLRYVVNYKARRSIKDRLFTKILDEFAKTNGKVKLASTTLQLLELPKLEIKMTDEKKN